MCISVTRLIIVMLEIIDFFLQKLKLSSEDLVERLCRLCCVFSHTEPKVIFVLSFISPPLLGDQGRFHGLWVHSLHGWEQFEVQLFYSIAAVYYFCEYGSQLDTQSLQKLVSCVKSPSYLLTVAWDQKKYLPWKESNWVVLLTVSIVMCATSSHAHENGGKIVL